MARTYKSSGVTKVTAASSTVVFNPGEIESAGVVAYHITFTGAGMINNDLTRVRVKANGVTIYDIDFTAHLAAFIQAMSPANTVSNAATDVSFTIPFYDLAAPTDDLADMQQFPRGAQATVELVIGAGGAAGTAAIGWTRTTVDPVTFPRLIGTPLNIAASQTNARFSFATDGIVAGFGINTVGLDNIRLVSSGEELVDMSGALFTQSRAPWIVPAVASDVDPLFFKLNAGLPADAGSSYFLLNTAAGWVGVANEVAIYEQVPQFE